MAPPASEAIAHAERLDLAPEQRQRLETLATEGRRDAVPLEAEAREAMAAFGRFVEESRAAGRTSLDEIGRRSEEVQQRSRALRALRELHAARVLATLNEGQRARLHEGRGTTTGGLR